MDQSVQDLLAVDGVHGLVLLSPEGHAVFASPDDASARMSDWTSMVKAVGPAREMDLLYDQGRLYIRRIDAGYLLVRMAPDTSIAMVKLSCDTLIPQLKPDRRSLFGR